MDLLSKKWWLGRIRPYVIRRGQPFHSPGLDFGEYGSRINFRDRFGNILFIEIDEDNIYLCNPGYTRKQLIPGQSQLVIKSFSATDSKTEIDWQEAGYRFHSITIKNNEGTSVGVKVRQGATNYLVGTSSYYYNIPGSKALDISTFSNPQEIDSQNAQDTILEIEGSSRNVTVYGLFTKII